MPEHVHLVLASNGARMAKVMQLVKGRFARGCNLRSGTEGSIWESRYHDVTLRSEKAVLEAMRYVLDNPVVAGLSQSPEEYRWSSANPRYFGLLDPL